MTNVPSFCLALDQKVNVPGLGELTYDIAYGGNFYAIVPVERVGLEFKRENGQKFLDLGLAISDAINEQNRPVHPENPDIAICHHIDFITPGGQGPLRAHGGLQAAARLFPGQALQLYHAHEAPLAGLSDRLDAAQSASVAAQQACEALVGQTPLPPDTEVHIQCERGAVTATLPAFVRQHDVDLVVLGIDAAPGLVSTLLGSTALRLLQWLPCDVLLVRSA